MKRRNFIAGLGGAAVAWPVKAWAQQFQRQYRLGWLIAFPENSPLALEIHEAFALKLRSFGWVEGENIKIDYRFAASDPARFTAYAAELVSLSPDAILATTTAAAVAVRERTRTIPIIFVVVPDPIGMGFVQSIPKPGGNMTGFISFDAPIIGKWLQLLKEVAPTITQVAALFNPTTAFFPSFQSLFREVEASLSLGVRVTLAPVYNRQGIEEVIAVESREPGRGLIVLPDSFNVTHRDTIIAASNRHNLPMIGFDIFAKAGGLMSYWFDTADLHAQAASYVDRVLKGEKPSELPVQTPTKYKLMINLCSWQAPTRSSSDPPP